MKILPENVTVYKRTDSFTEETVPPGLLKEHNTKENVWAKLNVEKGKLNYVITEPGEEEETMLTAGKYVIISPQQHHHVQINGKVVFHLEFIK